MDRSNSSAGPASTRRWTCEACGCNTNSENDRSCTICGTSNGSSLSRRAGYASRSGLFARSVAARRSFMQEELGMEGYDIWDRVDDDADMHGDEDEHAIAALAMEVASVSSRDPHRHRSVIDAARTFAMGREAARPEATELLRVAGDNASSYRPTWMDPMQIGGRMRPGNNIELGGGECRNVAHLPVGAGEGRALRALEAFPRSAPFASVTHNNTGHDRRPRRSFGFRVAFEHPTKEAGGNMGGYYLVGVTTTSFASFGERNALQQSPFFWGIEDSGNKYEGSRNPVSRDTRRGQSSYAVEIPPSEAKRNKENVLFGSREVITCVVDLESRSLTFWRDDELLGTLITNLPRGGNLYPVVVPYNAGSTVAITGMDADPVPLLRSFATDWKQALKEKNYLLREKLRGERATLIQDGAITPALKHVLKMIFSWYSKEPNKSLDCANPRLNFVEASRLLYRCGMKLSLLDAMTKGRTGPDFFVYFEEFVGIIEAVVQDEENNRENEEPAAVESPEFEVGDKVELVEGYERFGDAANGPLYPGERGVVIDLQEGPNGERHSVRIMHNTRRWWYQPQALVREKSGLMACPLVWFLGSILRVHGICYKSLKSFTGTEVTATSWQVGDAVVPKKSALRKGLETTAHSICRMEELGRVAPDSSSLASSRARETGYVLVEFVGKDFARACGVALVGSSYSTDISYESRRVPVDQLVHTTSLHGVSVLMGDSNEESEDCARDDETRACDNRQESKESKVNEQVLEDLKKMENLNLSAIENIKKECEKNLIALARVFEAGLAESVSKAIDAVLGKFHTSEDRDNIAQGLAALGKLLHVVAQTVFPAKGSERALAPVAPLSPEHQPKSDDEVEDDGRHGSRLLHGREERRLGRPDRVSDSALLQEVGRAGRLSSVQQRRSILLALMSRARRGNPPGDILHADPRGVIRGIGNAMPPLDRLREDAAALLFGENNNSSLRGVWGHAGNIGGLESLDGASSGVGIDIDHSHTRSAGDAQPTNREPENIVLDNILRSRSQKCCSSGQGTKPSCAPAAMLRSVLMNGILGNSLQWLKASSQYQTKKSSTKQISKPGSWLKSAVDEDGMPLLQLAVSLGCSTGIVSYLISLGAAVTETEIKLAAKLNLPDLLDILLQNSVYRDGMIDLQACADSVRDVIGRALERQKSQHILVCNEATRLLVTFLQKLVEMCLSMRYLQRDADVCSRAISDILVGNVLLTALQQRQKDVCVSAGPGLTRDGSLSPNAGRVYGPIRSNAMGLLGVIPVDVFGKFLVDEPKHLTFFLLLIEDYLCSKDIYDSAAGLSLLLSLLRRFPSFGRSEEMERFGFAELLLSHDAFASNRLAEIMSDATLRKPVVAKNDLSDAEAPAYTGVVLCPKQHAADLHVTLHSSFRCDLCGKGVERGRVMHGCRECDWDACERCTDEAEGGVVKWNQIRELVAECQRLSSLAGRQVAEYEEAAAFEQSLMAYLGKMNNNSEINNLSIRLLQRDRSSVVSLESVLNSRGELTMHQFIGVILPALHESLLGKRVGSAHSGLFHERLYRRSKKPRVARSMQDGADETNQSGFDGERLEFAKHLFLTHFPVPSSEQQKTGSIDVGDINNDPSMQECVTESTGGGETKPELLRRLHQVLSLYENVPTLPTVHRRVGRGPLKLGELQSLTKPLQLYLTPTATPKFGGNQKQNQTVLSLHAEPLTSVGDLSNHVIRACKISHPFYKYFCKRLASDSAVLLERPLVCNGPECRKWRICRVISYNDELGCNGVIYTSSVTDFSSGRCELTLSKKEDMGIFQFDGNVSNLMLAAREFFVISRDGEAAENHSTLGVDELMDEDLATDMYSERVSIEQGALGARAECNLLHPGQWQPVTVLDMQMAQTDENRYTVVSDDGEILNEVPESHIRGLPRGNVTVEDESILRRRLDPGRGRDNRGHVSRSFPFLSVRRLEAGGVGNDTSSSEQKAFGVLKRTWSALSLTESMRPVELTVQDDKTPQNTGKTGPCRARKWDCVMGDNEVNLYIDHSILESPPTMHVFYGIGHPPKRREARARPESTLISLLSQLYHNDENKLFSDGGHHLTYSIVCERNGINCCEKHPNRRTPTSHDFAIGNKSRSDRPFAPGGLEIQHIPMVLSDMLEPQITWEHPSRSRKFAQSISYDTEDDDASCRGLCDGLDEICVQCMEIIGILADLSEKFQRETDKKGAASTLFANTRLSKKLTEQLEDPLLVAGGLLPEWCFIATSFSPLVFSYDSRHLLLTRAAFGVSRSTLRQQESKVKDVGRFRQRMASLRARAVELVGEAFSGGAEDPTALQLQADELYGMEEALAAKVKANFRAARWDEHALQVAKAAVNRDLLIADAVSIMHNYANDGAVSRRRLEVRFNGESGFDAASGDEAGVTRGFYADVAEALLSCEVVAGISCASSCKGGVGTPTLSILVSSSKGLSCKLPLWIPDTDSSNQVIIPTPRANPGSGIGVYPRPLSNRHPQMPFVLEQFRFMGRLFASAMRDGFMFPLPLSTAFLKLVLHLSDKSRPTEYGWDALPFSTPLGTDLNGERCDGNQHRISESTSLLSGDLPRPGFLGGEVYAVEMFVCRALDRLDRVNPPLGREELEKKYKDIATDASFARVALGKNFDCSFEEYFRDRTFVDPLDPSQGLDAFPLCVNGHLKSITIHNIREWVSLAKQFILDDGVTAQAMAFRRGVEDLFSADYLQLFTPEELQSDVCGVGDNVDNWTEVDVRKLFKLDGGKGAAEALVAVAAIGGEGGAALSRRFGPSSPTIGFVVKALLEADPKMRRQFLSFVTSVPIVTPGLIEVVPMVSPSGEFLPMRDPTCLPRANTCARRLYLPKFETYESFSQVLWAVVTEESRFKGFYEWRGS